MRETVEQFEARTGARYQPPASLRAVGQRLEPGESCPTLFRYPGPLGLFDIVQGRLGRLGPAGRIWTWYAVEPGGVEGRGASLFGMIAVLEPLRLLPCRLDEPNVYVGLSAMGDAADTVAWVPPGMVSLPLWQQAASVGDVETALGDGYRQERQRVASSLDAYVEEISALESAGASPVGVAWCDVELAARERLLTRHGLTGRWTASAP